MLLALKNYNWGANTQFGEQFGTVRFLHRQMDKVTVGFCLQVCNFQGHFCHTMAALGSTDWDK